MSRPCGERDDGEKLPKAGSGTTCSKRHAGGIQPKKEGFNLCLILYFEVFLVGPAVR